MLVDIILVVVAFTAGFVVADILNKNEEPEDGTEDYFYDPYDDFLE